MVPWRKIGWAAGVLLVALLAFFLLRGGGPSGQRVTISLQNASGLITGADVRAGGVRVGRVEDIALGPGDMPQVKLRLERSYVVRHGATFDLRVASQAGELNRYIEVTAGKGAPLPDGVRIGLGQTDQPVELDDLLSTLDTRTRRNVRAVTAALDRSLQGHGGDLRASLSHADVALKQTAALLGDVTGDGTQLRRLVVEGNRVAGSLASDPQALQSTADRLAAALQTGAAHQADVAATVQDLGPGLSSARVALDRFRAGVPALRALVQTAGPAVHQARLAAPALAATLRAAPATLSEAALFERLAPSRLRTIQPLLADTSPVVRKAPSTLAQFAPVLDRLRAEAPDALGWLPLLGDALSNYDANGHAGRLMLIATPAPRKSVGPSQNAAGLLERPFARTPGVLEGEPWTNYQQSFIGDKPGPGGGGSK